jgi:transaldolase
MHDRLSTLQVKIFADGADKETILALAKNTLIQGFTTNPSLMRKAGVKDYETFCRELVASVPHRPFSFEVFSDDFDEMEHQALRIAGWGQNVYVKIPITNTLGQSCAPLVHRLARHGVRVNVTAIMTVDQVDSVIPALKNGPPSFVSMLAGRIADAGCDPLPSICGALTRLRNHPHIELIWASPRELFNVIQADQIGCHIISVSHDLLAKLPLLGRDLTEFSLETVKMFHADARSAGFTLA